MKGQIEHLIRELAETTLTIDAFNQYSYTVPGNSIRRHNLFLYLERLAYLAPQLLIVGEAAGYEGTRRTGIPLTSEYIMLKGIDKLDLFGTVRGYKKSDEFPEIARGKTATMVWEAIADFEPLPLLWDAFPFHSHKPRNELSNRTPTKVELAIGQPFLERLVDIYRIETIIAMGRKSERVLQTMGLSCRYVRHPSNGGKTKFMEGLGR